jgi:hypothetical protein
MITVDELKQCHVRSQMFLDGPKGSAKQHRYCVEHPRLRMIWSRQDRRDPGKTVWFVDDVQLEPYDFERAVELLNKPVSKL